MLNHLRHSTINHIIIIDYHLPRNLAIMWLFCLVLCMSHIYVSAETYYVTHTDNTSCPEERLPCMTLSQYANTSIGYFPSNTSLILLPGNHSLEGNLTISNITSLSILATDDANSTYVSCSSAEVRLKFEDIAEMRVHGIVFVGCISTVAFVDHFSLNECKLEGDSFGSRLELLSVNSAVIYDSRFTMNRQTTIVSGYDVIAGSLFVESSQYVSVVSSSFDSNYADCGSSIYARKSSIEIHKSKFVNSTAVFHGGAIHVVEESSLNIIESVFTDHSIERSETLNGRTFIGGGAISVFNRSVINVTNCVFRRNSAEASDNDTTAGGAVGGGGAFGASFSSVVFRDCVFVNNSAHTGGGGGLALSDHSSAVIERTVFLGNTGNMTAGAVACVAGSTCDIIGCSFHNNVAMFGDGGAIMCENCFLNTITNSTFDGNTALNEAGGALSIVCVDGNTCGGVISNTVFTNQRAKFGGAVSLSTAFVTINGIVSVDGNQGRFGVFSFINSKVLIQGRVTFSNNIGVTVLSFNSNVTFAGEANVFGNTMNMTTGIMHRGGTLSFYYSTVQFTDQALIYNNTGYEGGGIFTLQSILSVKSDLKILNNVATSSGGGIYAQQSELNFVFGEINLAENKAAMSGGGIYASDAIITVFGGSLLFSENSAESGGGLYLESVAKLYIVKYEPECSLVLSQNREVCQNNSDEWIRIVFANNSAIYGGGIFVADDTTSSTCSSAGPLLKSSTGECFFQSFYAYDTAQFLNIQRMIVELGKYNFRNVYFSNNSAQIAGDSLFGGLLDRCAVNPFAELLFGDPEILNRLESPVDAMTYISTTTDIDLTHTSSEPVRVCFCNHDGQPDCDYQPPTMFLRKGESFTLSLVALDHVQRVIPSVVHSVVTSNDTNSRGQTFQLEGSNCSEVIHQSLINLPIGIDSAVVSLFAEGPCQNRGISKATFEVHFLECPIGFIEKTNGCECDPVLANYVANCSVDTQLITKKENVWISYENGEYLVTSNCPFSYCKSSHSQDNSLNFNFTDAQCNFNRSGTVCGRCSGELSLLLGSSRCGKCTSDWLSLFTVFAIAGIALVTFMLAFNLTVAVGTINGLIFYANIITVNHATFFPPNVQRNINMLTVFISWVNLDFGFETCFYDGMDGYAKTWLQLAFPFYIMLLVVLVLIICEYSHRFAKFISNKNPVATLETLLLLSNTKLLRLIISGISYSRIKHFSVNSSLLEPSVTYVWREDGNLAYLGTKHIPLFIVIFILAVVVVLLILLITFWQCLQRCHFKFTEKFFSNAKFNSFVDAFHAPLRSAHRYWPGLLLVSRIFLYVMITVVSDPQVNLWTITVTAGILLFLTNFTGGGIYKKWPLNTLENFFLLNLLILATSTIFYSEMGKDQIPLTYASISIAFATFLAILVYHLYAYIQCCHKLIQKVWNRIRKKPDKTNKMMETFQTKAAPEVREVNHFSELRGHLDSILQVTAVSDLEGTSNHHPLQSIIEQHYAQHAPKVNVRAVTFATIDGVPYCEEEEMAIETSNPSMQ